MTRAISIVALFFVAVASLGVSQCNGTLRVNQSLDDRAGYLEPHTPGSGAPEEFVLPPNGPIEQILGASPDLNRVHYVRTSAEDSAPKTIVILVPGFLGGGSTFDPLARDLVRAYGGALEVWAVNRRSNQLEDRRGGAHALLGAAAGRIAGDEAAVTQALAEGIRFYFPDSDLDEDGNPDGAFELPDQVPGDGDSSFQRLAQDDLRFSAHWGVDTYVRDWRELVLAAREIVGDDGLVLFGGHSLGTTWMGLFAAYDFDAGPGVEAGHSLVDGLLLLEGGGTRGPSSTLPTEAEYLAAVQDLADGTELFLVDQDPATPECDNPTGACDNEVFLTSLFGFIDAVNLGGAGELNGLAASFQPEAPSLLQRTPLFGGIPVNLLLAAPMTNRALPGFFLDDDFSTNAAFSASFGFSANGSNAVNPFAAFLPGNFLVAVNEGVLRTWVNYDDPRFDPAAPNALACPPIAPPPFPAPADMAPGCAVIDNGPRPGPTDPPSLWGVEREVTDIDTFIRTLYENGNASEWYFVDGRPGLDFRFGRDSSALGRPDLLNVTQHATVDVPILGIGGSNGLTPTEVSFANYTQSTASDDVEIVIIEGYSHLDVVSAAENEAVPPIVDWVNRLRAEKLLGEGS